MRWHSSELHIIRTLLFSIADAQQAADDDSSEEGSSRAQYVSANCVVFTHYQGDAASVVDEHFSRALDKTNHAKGIIFYIHMNIHTYIHAI